MKKLAYTLLLAGVCAFSATAVEVADRLEAFPYAEGYGRYTTGGRGGAVYHVTTLEDNAKGESVIPGSFRWACAKSGKRTIVFDVSGTIMLKQELKLNQGNVTIAGQTAPGDGICVANYPFQISADNVIIRFMRFRLGNEAIKANPSAHEGDGLGGMDKKNIIVDHCSVSWSIDECLSVYGSKDITVQWTIATHSLRNSGHSKGSHGYGGNWGGSGASYHHNLMANHTARTPRLGPRPGTQTDERMDFRNNVIFNHGSNGCYGGEGMNVNMVNNYYKPGKTGNSRKARITGLGIRTLSYCFGDDEKTTLANRVNKVLGTSYKKGDVSIKRVGKGTAGINRVTVGTKFYDISDEDFTIQVEGTKIEVPLNSWGVMLHKWGTLYVDGNVNPADAAVTADNWKTGIYDQITISSSSNDNYWDDDIKASIKREAPLEYVYTTTHSAEDAYEQVLSYVGASLHRDEYDRMVVDDVRDGSHTFGDNGIIDSQDQIKYADGSTGWPKLESLEAPMDTDGDGMPDAWEMANGLDPNNANDGKAVTNSGYTNLEIYLNSLVDHIMKAGNQKGKMLNGTLHSWDPEVELPVYSGIDDIIADPMRPSTGRTYNLLGVEMRGDLPPGIYIRDGKKFIVK